MNLKMTYQTHGTTSNCQTDLLKPIWNWWVCEIVMWNWWVGISLEKLTIYIPCSDLTCMCNWLIKTIKYEFGYVKLPYQTQGTNSHCEIDLLTYLKLMSMWNWVLNQLS